MHWVRSLLQRFKQQKTGFTSKITLDLLDISLLVLYPCQIPYKSPFNNLSFIANVQQNIERTLQIFFYKFSLMSVKITAKLSSANIVKLSRSYVLLFWGFAKRGRTVFKMPASVDKKTLIKYNYEGHCMFSHGNSMHKNCL